MTIAMPQSLQRRGICEVCALVDSCERARDLRAPLMTCEKLEPNPVTVSEMIGRFLEAGIGTELYSGNQNHIGLCANCDHRDVCAFPRNEGGVWHCEEYA